MEEILNGKLHFLCSAGLNGKQPTEVPKAMHLHAQKLGDLDLWDGANERDLIPEKKESPE